MLSRIIRHGDCMLYAIGIYYERSNLQRKCRNNYKFDEGILYYKKKPDTSLIIMLHDSSFNGPLSHELQVQIASIYRLAIKDIRRSWIHGDRAASPAADCRYTYLWGNCLGICIAPDSWLCK